MMKPAFKYPGSKWRLAPTIIDLMPPHHVYVEAFGGSASVLIRKPRSDFEVYNDLNNEITNFFLVLREHRDELIDMIALTPYSKTDYLKSFLPSKNRIEKARRFYCRACMSISGSLGDGTAFKRQKQLVYNGRKCKPSAITWSEIDYLYDVAERFRGVQIEAIPADNLIYDYDGPDVVFYLDPPYPIETRAKSNAPHYAFEMTSEQHEQLLDVVLQAEGYFIISSYKTAMYDDILEGYTRIDSEVRINGNGSAVESIYISPNVMEYLESNEISQLSLF